MADRFTLPRIRAADPISDQTGRAVSAFVRFWDTVCRKIEGQEASQSATIAALAAIVAALQATTAVAQAAQQAANEAQATADAAGGGTATSGSATGVVDAQTSSWVSGPQVDLGGVTAGPLTISGSGPQQSDTTTSAATMTGEFRIVEIYLTDETPVFVGNFTMTQGSPPTVTNQSAAAVASFSLAQTSTGAVSYRIDARRTDGGLIVFPVEVELYLFVRRS